MFAELPQLRRDETGAASAEYVILASLIAIVCMVGAAILGTTVGSSIGNSAGRFPP